MKSYNYEDLGFISPNKPQTTHLFIETLDGYLYLVDSVDNTKLYKSTDKGESWDLITTRTKNILFQSYDRTNGYIYFIDSDQDGTTMYYWYLDLSNDSVHLIGSTTPTDVKAWDYILFNGTDDHICYSHNNAGDLDLYIGGDSNNMGTIGVRTYEVSYLTVVSNIAYFLFKWSDENVGLWSYNDTTTVFTKLEDMGANTSIPERKRQGIAYDGSNVLYFVLEDTNDSKFYLYSYIISTDILTKLGEHNVSLMLDRNTASGVMEKAFHIIEYKVYQLHPHASHQLYYISKVPSDAILIGITDNFLMNNDGDVFEYIDVSSSMVNIEFAHEIMYYSEGTLGVDRDEITIEKGMFMQIEGKYTTSGSSSDEIIFEGIVVDFDGERLQKVWLESPAKKELLEKKPRGDFSGRSDEIMTTLLSTYCKYVTKGTFSVGTAMGTVTYAGDKSLMTILIELALFEKWIWKLRPQGELDFNDGTIDSLINLSSSDKIFRVKTGNVREPYNYFYVKGAIVSGVQLYKELEEADDLTSQQLHGYNPYEKTYASFNSQSKVNTLTTNIKARLKESPLVVEHWYYDASLGMIAIAETVTFVYNTNNVNVSSDQFLINRVLFKAKENIGGYTIADKLV